MLTVVMPSIAFFIVMLSVNVLNVFIPSVVVPVDQTEEHFLMVFLRQFSSKTRILIFYISHMTTETF
jgi:hypothetical protein